MIQKENPITFSKPGVATKTLALLLVLDVAVFSVAATAAVDVIDQKNDGPFGGGFTTSASPIGQSFKPALDKLDFVELLINDQIPGVGNGVNLAVNIRLRTTAGSIVGTSQTVIFRDQTAMQFQTPEVVRFPFNSPVSLQPGLLYVIEPFKLPGPDPSPVAVFGTGYGIDAYPNGESFFNGQPYANDSASQPPFDLWFREGVVAVAEPSSGLLALCGVLTLSVWMWHRGRSQ